jgi:hypothetical protein
VNYQPQFEMGQNVWIVTNGRMEYIVKCLPCQHTGKIKIGDEEFVCPKCSGAAAHPKHRWDAHYIQYEGRIGRIQIDHTSAYYLRQNGDTQRAEVVISYMIDETGVGSGNVWPEDSVFGSREEAQAFCDRQNGLLPKDECEMGAPIIDRFGKINRERIGQ